MSDRPPTSAVDTERHVADRSPLDVVGDHSPAGFDGAGEPLEVVPLSTPLATALADLAEGRRTGLLRIGAVGEVWFDDGRIYLATGPGSPPLFDVLFGADVGCRERLEAICVEADRGGAPVVERLVDGDPDVVARLRRLLHEHVLAALFELMVPSRDPVVFEPGARHVVGSRYAEPAPELLASVQRRVELWRRIAERVPSTTVRFRMSPTLPGQASDRLITADEWTFLARLDGRRTVASIITETGESAFRVCSLLYRLLLEELIEPVGD